MGKIDVLIDPAALTESCSFDLQQADHVRTALPKLFQHLAMNTEEVIRVRVRPGLEGAVRALLDMEGVSFRHISARSELASRLHCELPDWMTNEFVIRFELLERSRNVGPVPDAIAPEDIAIWLRCPHLMSAETGEAACQALLECADGFAALCGNERTRERLSQSFARTHSERTVRVVETLVFEAQSPTDSLEDLLHIAQLEPYRNLAASDGLGIAFPPRLCSSEILMELAADGGAVIAERNLSFLLAITNAVLTQIDAGHLEPAVLATYVKQPIPDLLDRLREAILTRPRYATLELQQALLALRCSPALELATVVGNLIEAQEPPPLIENATTRDALAWAGQYLAYAMNKWRRTEEPSAALTRSFASWIIANPARRINGPADWRRVSTTVRSALDGGNAVALIIVDALSALVSPELVNRLQSTLPGIAIRHETIFAPIPTLTETSKAAVSTGQATVLGASIDAVIRASYGSNLGNGEIQVEKSWSGVSNDALGSTTKLFVYFENHIDDLIHDCSDLSTFDRQLPIIFEKIVELTSSLFAQARQQHRQLVTVISADHGFALLRGSAMPTEFVHGGMVIRDRCIEGVSASYPIADFAHVWADGVVGNRDFLIPLGRDRLRKSNASVSHGGLAPEEVLIPLIVLASPDSRIGQSLLIECPDTSISRVSGGWEVVVVLTAVNESLKNVRLSFRQPFVGSESVGEVIPGIPREISTILRSPVEQSGVTTVGVCASYLTPAGRVMEIEARFALALPPLLLKGTAETKAFDQMFD